MGPQWPSQIRTRSGNGMGLTRERRTAILADPIAPTRGRSGARNRPRAAYDRGAMSPVLLLILLIAGLLALLPVWRLRAAGWRTSWLLAAWLGYGLAIFVAIRLPFSVRFLVPILVLAFVAPFVAGPERLNRFAGPRRDPPRPIIDVTPRPPASLPDPEDDEEDRR
jgi:hypothetical protein